MYHPWQSTAPAAVDALVAMLTLAFADNDEVIVHDGPWTTGESRLQYIVVGWSGFTVAYPTARRAFAEELGTVNLSATAMPEGLGPSIREKFAIECASIALEGGADNQIAVARRKAYANLTSVGAAIAANHTLSGTVLKTVMGITSTLHQVNERRGALAIVQFSVEVEAYAQQ